MGQSNLGHMGPTKGLNNHLKESKEVNSCNT